MVRILLESGARTVLDLGCGSGALLERILEEPQFDRVVGVDSSIEVLARAERLRVGAGDRLSLRHASFTSADEGLAGFDAATMIETIEHVPPEQLSLVERAVFTQMRPRLVVMTTPNREYNQVYGIPDGEMRHPDHRFEWDRARFRSWASGLGERAGYGVRFEPIGPSHSWLGSPSQMAVFRLGAGHAEPPAGSADEPRSAQSQRDEE